MPEAPNEKLYVPSAQDPPKAVSLCDVPYAELDVTTNFSFLHGASHPDELVYQAAELGYRAMAVTDINTLAGVVRAYSAAKEIAGFQLIVGARLVFMDQTPDLLVWPTDRAAYARLCRLLTLGRRRAPKGECHLTIDDFLDHEEGMLAAFAPQTFARLPVFDAVHDVLGDRLSIAISLGYDTDDTGRLHAAQLLAKQTGIPIVATNHVHYHDPARRALQDVLTCVRHGCTIHDAGFRLFQNAERHLKPPERMHRLFADFPAAIRRGLQIAKQCRFTLAELKYEYPVEAIPPGVSAPAYLRELTYAKAADRYPDGIPEKVTALLEKELTFIQSKNYESYFLTVYDLVREARSRGILCQGRGSAANSAVCYCLGVTAVDPMKFQLVFERFASDARQEPPDIDIDFEHERREEVIQYVYQKYGRDRAAMTGSLITYRGRSAVRDVGKALGFSQDACDVLAGKIDWWHKGTLSDGSLVEAGIRPDDPTVRHLIALATMLLGFPRHLSQHVGGMVISRSLLCELVPIENAAMEDRTVIEWDKDDLDALGLFKVDLLALGMLTCLSKAMVQISSYTPAPPLELHTIPSEDPQTYEMISDADTVGVFQIESRAQMSMLPRMKPNKFYDLVIEVAIVRPGPIQGDMVHPYLRRRMGQEPVEYPKEELKEVLEKTLGVPLFQEQAMRLAIVAAGFTGAEADELRRAMAAWKRSAGLGRFHDKFVFGMTNRGYDLEFAERCFRQIAGFGEYGFPESHAASFALLVYASCWMKRHHPAAFACSLLNSQPMGFYAPAQIVRDAREHGVEVRPVDVNFSQWDCTLEDPPDVVVQASRLPLQPSLQPGRLHHNPKQLEDKQESPDIVVQASRLPLQPGRLHHNPKQLWGKHGPALRLGMRQIKGMRQADAERIEAARSLHGPFTSAADLQHAAGIDVGTLRRLARADALASLALTRRQATWETLGLTNVPAPLVDGTADLFTPPPAALPVMPLSEEVTADYATIGMSLKRHPVSFARGLLEKEKVLPASALLDEKQCPHGRWVRVAGLVLVRQRPGTASGVVFITLEDETGIANLILWSMVYERYRTAARHATLLLAEGVVQREEKVVHLLARRLFDRTELLQGIEQASRDFH